MWREEGQIVTDFRAIRVSSRDGSPDRLLAIAESDRAKAVVRDDIRAVEFCPDPEDAQFVFQAIPISGISEIDELERRAAQASPPASVIQLA